jgi:hypothetical protein
MKLFIVAILCLIGSNAYAFGTVYCSHKELCKLAEIIAQENKITNLNTQSLVNISGDPHEFEPSTTEIKNLMSASLLLTGPTELNPWIKKINFQRSKNPTLKTISLLFDKTMTTLYPNATPEVLSHFWLYPKIYCLMKTKLESELKAQGLGLLASKSCNSTSTESNLNLALRKTLFPIILTHDALLPLLKNLDPNHNIVAIKGSGHHEETSAQAIKKMYDSLRAPIVIWVIEANINVPQNILSKIRVNDLVIKLDTAKSNDNTPFFALNDLTEKLNKLSEKK